MEHKLNLETLLNQSITIIEDDGMIVMQIDNDGSKESALITKKELHSFIGVLLHVQQKMK
jgi:hypothetical protein